MTRSIVPKTHACVPYTTHICQSKFVVHFLLKGMVSLVNVPNMAMKICSFLYVPLCVIAFVRSASSIP